MFLCFRHDHARTDLAASLAHGSTHFIRCFHIPGAGSHALGVLGEVDLQVLPFETIGGLIPGPEFSSKAGSHSVHLELPNRLEPVILRDYDRDLQVFLRGRMFEH